VREIHKWACSRCGFSVWQEEGCEPEHFELTMAEWDCTGKLRNQQDRVQCQLSRIVTLCQKLDEPLHPRLAKEIVDEVMES
jgi:hypothetical protein